MEIVRRRIDVSFFLMHPGSESRQHNVKMFDKKGYFCHTNKMMKIGASSCQKVDHPMLRRFRICEKFNYLLTDKLDQFNLVWSPIKVIIVIRNQYVRNNELEVQIKLIKNTLCAVATTFPATFSIFAILNESETRKIALFYQ